VSCNPFQDFDDALFYNSESEEVLEKPLASLDPSCYSESDDVIKIIDEFIHSRRCKWDVIGHDEDPIYDIEGHLQQPYLIATNSKFWHQGDDMIKYFFQPPRDEFL
jgi:hypothetical protein